MGLVTTLASEPEIVGSGPGWHAGDGMHEDGLHMVWTGNRAL